ARFVRCQCHTLRRTHLPYTTLFRSSLLVLKAIHKYDVAFGVPQLAVTFGIIMAIICALLLVYFVQHMVHAIQASHVIEGASNERSEEHTSELQSRENLVCRLPREKK